MDEAYTMNRRTTMKLIVAAGTVTAGGGTYHWLTKDRQHASLNFELAHKRVSEMPLVNSETEGAWRAARTLHHLAQSIEFSIEGFPELKSELFRSTVGPLAFSVFKARGQMMHSLEEIIPGEVVTETDMALAKERLLVALERFDSHSQPLQPHFAYGALNKQEYAIAHVLHLNDHLGV
jgi:hypothetical protein